MGRSVKLSNLQKVILIDLAYQYADKGKIMKEAAPKLRMAEEVIGRALNALVSQGLLIRFELEASATFQWGSKSKNLRFSVANYQFNAPEYQEFQSLQVMDQLPSYFLRNFQHNIHYYLVTEEGKNLYEKAMKQSLERNDDPAFNDFLKQLNHLDSSQLTRVIIAARKLKKSEK